MPSVERDELVLTFDFVSASAPFEHSAYISRSTGEIFWESDLIDNEEELPEDLGDLEKYIEIPHKNELHLGRRLVLKFVDRYLPQEYENVENAFRRRGAYSRYKATLESHGQLDAWHQFEEDETEAALMQWCADEGITLIEGSDGEWPTRGTDCS